MPGEIRSGPARPSNSCRERVEWLLARLRPGTRDELAQCLLASVGITARFWRHAPAGDYADRLVDLASKGGTPVKLAARLDRADRLLRCSAEELDLLVGRLCLPEEMHPGTSSTSERAAGLLILALKEHGNLTSLDAELESLRDGGAPPSAWPSGLDFTAQRLCFDLCLRLGDRQLEAAVNGLSLNRLCLPPRPPASKAAYAGSLVRLMHQRPDGLEELHERLMARR